MTEMLLSLLICLGLMLLAIAAWVALWVVVIDGMAAAAERNIRNRPRDTNEIAPRKDGGEPR